jgi:hypothetical protein
VEKLSRSRAHIWRGLVVDQVSGELIAAVSAQAQLDMGSPRQAEHHTEHVILNMILNARSPLGGELAVRREASKQQVINAMQPD